MGFEDFPSRHFCGLHFHHSRPLQKAALVVAAVCDRRRFPIISRPLGAHRAPLQGFCRGSHSSVWLCVLWVLLRPASEFGLNRGAGEQKKHSWQELSCGFRHHGFRYICPAAFRYNICCAFFKPCDIVFFNAQPQRNPAP
jgi:hypothetical protein